MSQFFSPRNPNPIIRWWFLVDRLTLMMIIILATIGIIMVATASPSVAERNGLGSYHFLFRHLLFIGPAMGLMIGLSFLKDKWVYRFGFLMLIGAIIGVLLTLLIGSEIKGATRWIRIFGFSIQPSEFLKPAFIICSAWLLAYQKQNINFPGIIAALCLYGISAGLLLLQPDFGMFFVITIIFGMQIFLIGFPLRIIFTLGGIALIGILGAYLMLDHVQSRVDRFLFPESGDTYQMDRSKEAFMNGGLIGTGLGQGTVKNQVPDVHADFIFTAMGEEWGFAITALFVVMLGYLYYRMLSKFVKVENLFTMVAGSGLVFMMIVQSFIHMGSALQLIPAKGMTLPLISYGGSSLVAIGISFGLILAMSRGFNDDTKRGTWRHLTRQG